MLPTFDDVNIVDILVNTVGSVLLALGWLRRCLCGSCCSSMTILMVVWAVSQATSSNKRHRLVVSRL